MTETQTVIRPEKGMVRLNLGEILCHRDLLLFFIWKEIKVRYNQTVLGVGWALLQPLIQMVIFSVFFGRLMKVPSQNFPYPIFVYSALLPWTFFSSAMTLCNNAVMNNAGLIRKVWFPRLLIPLSAVGTACVDFLAALIVLFGLMWFSGVAITWNLLFLLPLIVAEILLLTGIGTFIAGLSATYRDFRHIVPFGIQIWMFLTPVIYPASIVGARHQWLFNLNPMTGIVNGFRAAILNLPPDWNALGFSLGAICILLPVGVLYFNRVETQFADRI
ncbi:MAG: ABC transporter permease [Candidatus Neomarinimicrobiota bacterium]